MSQQLIAVDFHCKYQKVAWLDPPSGEICEADVDHADPATVRDFYSRFEADSIVGMEVSGYSFWFEQLIEEMGFELQVAHPGTVARMRRRRQKNDRRDAYHLLELMVGGELPTIWRPSPTERQHKILVRHLARLTRERTRWINVLRALVYNYNLHIKRGYLSKARKQDIAALEMTPRLNQLRDELLASIEGLQTPIKELEAEIKELAHDHEAATRLMTIPGIGPMTSLYLVSTLGPVKRFATSKQVVAYAGLDSVENSSDNRHRARRYGSISKQGDRQMRWLLNQSATTACSRNPQLRRFYLRLKHRKPWPVAKMAVARKLLVCCYVLLRDSIDYAEFVRRGSGMGLPDPGTGLK